MGIQEYIIELFDFELCILKAEAALGFDNGCFYRYRFADNDCQSTLQVGPTITPNAKFHDVVTTLQACCPYCIIRIDLHHSLFIDRKIFR